MPTASLEKAFSGNSLIIGKKNDKSTKAGTTMHDAGHGAD